MYAMDSVQRAVAAEAEARGLRFDDAADDGRVMIVDAIGRTGLHLHRPGARFLDAGSTSSVAHARQLTMDAMRRTARENYERDLTSAWKGNADTENTGSGPQEGPKPRSGTGDAKADAYQTYDQELADAWRSPR